MRFAGLGAALRRVLAWGLVFGLVGGVLYVALLDFQVRERFEGKRWALPAQVYARPLELYPGLDLTPDNFEQELELLGYRAGGKPSRPGTYQRTKSQVRLVSRDFVFWDAAEPSRTLEVRFDRGRIDALRDGEGEAVGLARLDPVHIGAIYPAQREDRILVRLDEVPEILVRTLIEIEDRGFYDHHGLDLRAIARAVWANVRAGGVVQGGSTLTQQLVKNFYLSSERTLWRKLNEAVMAVSLEWHYTKDEILEAYLNEVYLGQSGQQAIHGFGLGSWFYFHRPLAELDIEHLALLVGLVKGPSFYNPRRNAERVKQRRDLILDTLAERGVIAPAEAQAAKARPLGVTDKPPVGTTRFPGFMDLVRRQLQRDYKESDLTSEGLRIFTTLDPQVQDHAERAIAGRIRQLEERKGMPEGQLQGAVVVTAVESGEVLAVVGDRDPAYAGFNRALDASRQVGSLIKPAVYLTALSRPEAYTVATVLDDGPLSVARPGQPKPWRPKNYDGRYHGEVLLREALIHSYNLATARLGLDVGIDSIVDTLRSLGAESELEPYPALALGAANMTPIEVAQIYQTIAGGGFRTPLRAIREVLTADGLPLQRYGLEVAQAFDPAPVFLLTTILQDVPRRGTGRQLARMLGDGAVVAGKTGTTDELRDSWFAGFSADRLAVVWLGRDDNTPAGLSGAAGAMMVWGDVMQRIESRPLEPTPPVNVEWQWIDPQTGYGATQGCPGALHLPFIAGSGPNRVASCVVESAPSAPRAPAPAAARAMPTPEAAKPAPLASKPKPTRRNSPLDWLTDER